MKITHLITRLIIGGAQENTVLTCRGLVELGHDVTLVAGPETGAEGSLWDQAKDSGTMLTTASHIRRAVNPWHDTLAIAELTRIFREISPDVVHTHSSKAGILGRLAAHRAQVPIIIHTIHGMSFNRTQGAISYRMYRSLERFVAKYTTMFVTVADAMIEQSVQAGIGPRERFITIRSGMEAEHFTPDPIARQRWRQKWGLTNEHVVVGTVARLFENKGYDEIIAAMPPIVTRVPFVRFVWIGEGKHRHLFEKQLKRLGLHDRVIFAGLITPNQVGEMINGFDMVVHASRWEGLPRALVQGLLLEKPGVSFDNDGAPEVIKDGVTGLLAPMGDVAAFADRIVRLSVDVELRLKMGREGRRICLQQFEWRQLARKMADLYERLAEKSKKNA